MVRGFLNAKSKGQLLQIPAVLIAGMIAIIILFSVVLPVTNTGITATASNLTGYTGALQVAQQLPLMLILVPFVTLAVVVVRSLGGF